MQVLLRLVRIVPDDLLLEASGRGVMIDPAHVDADDAFERVEHGAGAQTVERILPVRARPQVHGVMVSVGKPESQEQPPGGLESEGINQFLPKQAHGGRAEDHDALVVQPDDTLIGPEIEQFREVQDLPSLGGDATGALRSHNNPFYDPFRAVDP